MGKQSCLLAACPAPDLDDDIFAVVDVLGQQQNFEIIFQLCHILTLFADLLLYHLLEVRIESLALEQGFRLRKMILRCGQCLIRLYHGFCLVVFLHQAAEQRGVGSRLRLIEPHRKFLKPAADRLHLGKQF